MSKSRAKPSILTVHQVAEKLGVTEQHVHDLICAGQLQAVDVGGGSKRYWRIPIEAYEQFVKTRNSLVRP